MSQKSKLRKSMYEEWIANIISGGNIPLKYDKELGVNSMTVHYNYVETGKGFIRYFMINKWPDYLETRFLDTLRDSVMRQGVRMNYYVFGEPHQIPWESPEMQNRINIWRRYTEDADNAVNAFDYRETKASRDQKFRLIRSTLYLNKAELEQKRTMCKVTITIQIMCDKDETSIVNCNAAVKSLISQAKLLGIGLKEVKLNMIDWLQFLSIFSLRQSKETTGKFIKKVLTDDIVANFAGLKQGRIGDKGVPIGTDIKRKETVLYMFKEDPNKPENWLIGAETGGGKSYFLKAILPWMIASGLTVTILDYEGDEYDWFVKMVRKTAPNKVKKISMGKGSAAYVDPMAIPDLTGDPDIDDDLKETAMNFTMAMFRVILHGTKGQLTIWEDSVISMAIARVYDEYCVTNDKSTWKKSKNITVRDVYECIEEMVRSKELVDDTTENVKHRAAMQIVEAGIPYFTEDGAKSGAFKQPIKVSDVQEAKLIVFSFGAKGAAASTTDQTVMALKQLSVANISTQISNYSKYVRKCFNVKVWEEYQRYGEIEGSGEVIANSMTGGRKRGDINFIITNVITNVLDDTNPINKTLRQNITSYSIGKIKDADVIKQFCAKFQLSELEEELLRISKATGGKKSKRYKHAFCVIFDNGNRAVVKTTLPKKLAENPLFSTGISNDASDRGIDIY